MQYHYSDYIAFQEDPETTPNELAHLLSELLGIKHFSVHQALVAANPELVRKPNRTVLKVGSLKEVEKLLHNFEANETSQSSRAASLV